MVLVSGTTARHLLPPLPRPACSGTLASGEYVPLVCVAKRNSALFKAFVDKEVGRVAGWSTPLVTACRATVLFGMPQWSEIPWQGLERALRYARQWNFLLKSPLSLPALRPPWPPQEGIRAGSVFSLKRVRARRPQVCAGCGAPPRGLGTLWGRGRVECALADASRLLHACCLGLCARTCHSPAATHAGAALLAPRSPDAQLPACRRATPAGTAPWTFSLTSTPHWSR